MLMTLKQKKIKFKPRINLNHDIYIQVHKKHTRRSLHGLHNHSTLADNYDQDDTIISFSCLVNSRR